MMRSHASATEKPMPTHAPLTAQMTGFSRLTRFRIIRWRRFMRSRLEIMSTFCMLPTSLPEQNALPAPVRMTARTLSSVWSSAKMRVRSVYMSSDSAFIFSARSSVTVARPFSISTFTFMLLSLLLSPKEGEVTEGNLGFPLFVIVARLRPTQRVVRYVSCRAARGGRCENRRSKMLSAIRFFSISIEPPAIIQPREWRKHYSTSVSCV